MKKKILSLILALAMVLPLVPVFELPLLSTPVFAATSGTTGDCTWTLDGTTLTISGNGAMGDYNYNSTLPWGTSITDVVIESGVTTVGNYAFYNCKSLTNASLPGGVTVIGECSFALCSALKSITIPSSIKTFGNYAFRSCSSLPGIVIPDKTTSIGSDAFYGCFKFKDIIIPNSVTSIGTGAFGWCTSLTSIAVDENNTAYYSSGNCLIKKSTKAVVAGCKTSVIPNEVTSIGEDSFSGCFFVTITIPDSVTKIGGWAFAGSDLTSITLPKKLTSIGDGAFFLCDALTDVYYLGTRVDEKKVKIGASNSELTNAKWHYSPCENDAHLYDHICSTICKNCDYTRTANTSHTYEDNCDEICNICSEARKVRHNYEKKGENIATCKNCNISKTFDFIITTDESITLSYKASREFSFTIEDTSIAKIDGVGSSIVSAGSYYQQTSNANILPVFPGETIVKIVTTDGSVLTTATLLVVEGEHQMQFSEVLKEPNGTEPGIELYVCKFCGHKEEVEIPGYTPGDVDGSGVVDLDDVIQLLFYLTFPESYPVNQPVDFDGTGVVDLDDVIHLLFHLTFPESYPLQ